MGTTGGNHEADEKIKPLNKDSLSQKLEGIYAQINELARSLSANPHPEINVIWSDLANARAFLADAIQSAKTVKAARVEDYQI